MSNPRPSCGTVPAPELSSFTAPFHKSNAQRDSSILGLRGGARRLHLILEANNVTAGEGVGGRVGGGGRRGECCPRNLEITKIALSAHWRERCARPSPQPESLGHMHLKRRVNGSVMPCKTALTRKSKSPRLGSSEMLRFEGTYSYHTLARSRA